MAGTLALIGVMLNPFTAKNVNAMERDAALVFILASNDGIAEFCRSENVELICRGVHK